MTAEPVGPQPTVRRSKITELTRTGAETYRLQARLTDQSDHGDYGPDGGTGLIHDFVIEGTLEGPDLVITALDLRAEAYPFAPCPSIAPSCQALVGHSLASGWRRAVLANLAGSAGCTHVTTLLLGLAETRTMAFFLQMNDKSAYSPQTRADGRWMRTGLQIAPTIVNACHALSSGGPVVSTARARTQAVDTRETEN